VIKVSVIGTGYVGLVSGVCLAEVGHQVLCVDVDQAKVDRINAGDPPIYEVGLEALLNKNIGRTLRATSDLRQAVLDRDLADRGRHALRRRGDRSHVRPRGRRGDRRGAEGKGRLSYGGGEKHRGPRHHRGRRPADPRRGLGQAGGRRFRRRHESRVPQGRRGDRRLHGPRPDRARRHRCPQHRRARRALCGLSRRRQDPHQPAHRRDDQVHGQFPARHADLVFQRDRQSLRPGRRRCGRGDGGRASRQALLADPEGRHPRQPRLSHLSRGGLRVRRLVLSQGREGADRLRKAAAARWICWRR
jgi:hypothetical protein